MKRGLVLALAAALSACAPAPVHMPAAQAAEVLNLFSAGRGPANVCSADGRALLRGAVRAYSREMNRSGVAWPGTEANTTPSLPLPMRTTWKGTTSGVSSGSVRNTVIGLSSTPNSPR